MSVEAMQVRIDVLEARNHELHTQEHLSKRAYERAAADVENLTARVRDLERELHQYRTDFATMSDRAKLLAATVTDRELRVEALQRALDRCVDDKHRLAKQLDQKTTAIAAFGDAVSRAESASLSRGRGGQQVPFHGDFAGANPGVLVCLRRWAALLQGDAP